MKNIKVNLGIARSSGNLRLSKGANAVSPTVMTPELKKMIFERDEQTCQCCGFKADKYQDIHFIDNNPKNLDPENLLTTCIFCHNVLIWNKRLPCALAF